MLVTGLLTCTITLSAWSNILENNPKEEATYRPPAPKGNWVADYEVKLLIFTLKSVICDRSHDQLCVTKKTVNARTALVVHKANGESKKICEGTLVGYEVSPDETEAHYTFENEGYTNH